MIPEAPEEFRKNVNSEPMPESARGDFARGGGAGGEYDFDLGILSKKKENSGRSGLRCTF